MNWFLAKTDPDSYSLSDFQKEGETVWDGVHSYAAIGFIKQMKLGDKVYIYESLSSKAIVGLATVTGEPFLNTEDKRFSWAVKMKFVKKYEKQLSLKDIKADPALANFDLVRIGRLSVMTVPPEIQKILAEKLS